MGNWPRLVNLRRAARGYIQDTGEPTVTTISLFNDSLGPEYILVWQLGIGAVQAHQFSTSMQQFKPLPHSVAVQPMVPGDARPPGVLSSGDQPTLFTPDWNDTTSFGYTLWPPMFPFAVLPPGWALMCQPVGMGPTSGLDIWFVWEAILAKYFNHIHTHAQLEIDLIAQSGG